MDQIVTIAWLKANGAGAACLDTFRRTFGESASLTADNIRLAASAGLSLDWFAERFLPAARLREFGDGMCEAMAAYRRRTNAAEKEYDRTKTLARREWDRAEDEAEREYERAAAGRLIGLLGLAGEP